MERSDVPSPAEAVGSSIVAAVSDSADVSVMPDSAIRLVFRKPGVFVCPSVRSLENSIGGVLQILQVPPQVASSAEKDAIDILVQWTSYASLSKLASNLSLSTSFLDLGTGQTVASKENKEPARNPVNTSGPGSKDSLSKPESYEIKIPLHQIHSIKKVVPALGSGTPYIIIFTDKGIALPPLYFTSGGIKEMFTALKSCAYVTRSEEDSNLFLINDTANMLVKSMTSLEESNRINGLERRDRAGFFSDISLSILGAFSKVPKMGRKAIKSLKNEEKHRDEDVRKPSSIHYSLGEFELVDDGEQQHAIELPQVEREAPVTAVEWRAAFDPNGKVSDPSAIKRRIFKGGVENSIRKECWKFLLGYYSWNTTYSEREALSAAKRDEYLVYKRQWQSITKEQEKHFAKFRNRRSRVEKDVARTDRDLPVFKDRDGPGLTALHNILMSYIFFNFDVGYVQGMNDLAAPMWLIMQDESEAFWCFKHYMETMSSNFDKDQQGMNTHFLQLERLLRCIDPTFHQYLGRVSCLNMFFVYRWILINFKREFSCDDVMVLWEAIWTNYLHPKFHLFIALAMLLTARGDIISQRMGFDQILQCMNNLSGKLSADDVLKRAEALFRNFDARTDDEVKQAVFVAAPRQEAET
eukprot:TRINITY_DN2576_c0_g1_i19.p1 TRINITY_DN2576_c0_g1~~TRINITY_DN2576_c0_g1_i19.p1  ORF type:complete len:639 (+),score=86.92 TRINITY_DN2576_c0_g1_i19:279-2195(+)